MGIETSASIGAVIVMALLAASAFFSSSETAIFSLPADRVEAQGEAGPRTLALAELRSDPHRLLVTLLVGNNIVNVAISSVITAAFASRFAPGLAVTGATVVASTVVLIFGEIVPKSYGLSNAEEWSLTVATPLAGVERALYPLVVTFDGITRQLNDRLSAERALEETYLDN